MGGKSYSKSDIFTIDLPSREGGGGGGVLIYACK